MKSEQTDEINLLIQNLDNLLYQGYLLKTHTIDDWNIKSKQVENKPDVDQYRRDYEQKINVWLNQTAQVLFNRLKEKHYYFHFVNPEAGLSFTFSHPLGNLTHSLEKHLFALEDVVTRLEERKNLAVRQEIAEKEYQMDILYKITYSDHTREVKLNNIILTKTDFNSENDNFFAYIYENPSRPISLSEIKDHIGAEPKKRLAHIVRDLGFVHELREIFFPVLTKNEIMFVNPITKQYFYKHNLPSINFKRIGRQSEIE